MRFTNRDEFKDLMVSTLANLYSKNIDDASDVERYHALSRIVMAYANENRKSTKDKAKDLRRKRVFYFSLEFLLGRMLLNNIMNLGIYDIVNDGLKELGIELSKLEEIESDAGLGNGGLGRLAACFLDSLATCEYLGNGNTIRYQYGLFKQLIQNNEQIEVPDQWLRYGNPWEVRKPHKAVSVKFYGKININRDPQSSKLTFEHVDYVDVLAVPYDMPVIGKDTDCTNHLRMWSAEPSDDLPKGYDFHTYLSNLSNICMNVYPDDSTEEGKYTRLKQEYFFVSAGLQSIVNDHLKFNKNLDNLADQVVIQLNDTHPAMAIAELMRILVDIHNYEWDQAFKICEKVFAYTNHTVLSEALEKWPVEYIQKLLPRIYLIIEEIDRKFKDSVYNKTKDINLVNRVAIIRDNQIHMAHLSIVGSFSVNGVAKIHSNILINELFKDFYSLMPEKFNNKTNGITPRRWLLYSNPELCNLIEKYIGPAFRTNINELEKLLDHVDNENLQREFLEVKKLRKIELAKFLKHHHNIDLDTDSIFDAQAKRLHAYKRQLLNILHVIYLYNKIISDENFTMPKTTFLFGAKAAPAYYFAKKVIKLINSVAQKIKENPRVNQFIDVVFIPNYRVSVAEKLMNASDVSEQISTAGKEASGTGNMKFMMNGAITLGTMDGANVEIVDLVGYDNAIIFGKRAEEIHQFKLNYNSSEYYRTNPQIRETLDRLIDKTFSDNEYEFIDIYNELVIHNDEYLLLADFEDYIKAHEKLNELYLNPNLFAKKCLINIAKSPFFSSDRTIENYANEIWRLKKLKNDKIIC